jgi:hypothetical protein
MVDRFGHWIESDGREFNQRLWAMTFKEIYHGKPGPARTIKSIRFLTPQVAVVQARANRPDGRPTWFQDLSHARAKLQGRIAERRLSCLRPAVA